MGQTRGELERLLGRLLGGRRSARGAVHGRGDPGGNAPTSPGESLVEQRLQHVEEELAELRSRVNGLLFTVIGAVVVQVLLRLLG